MLQHSVAMVAKYQVVPKGYLLHGNLTESSCKAAIHQLIVLHCTCTL